VQPAGDSCAGTVLIARGEFSIVIAGRAAGVAGAPKLGSVAAAYVLLAATAGPLVTRFADRAARPNARAAAPSGPTTAQLS
jgi:monovalent cation:H+ antiporter-2, CPA2 family